MGLFCRLFWPLILLSLVGCLGNDLVDESNDMVFSVSLGSDITVKEDKTLTLSASVSVNEGVTFQWSSDDAAVIFSTPNQSSTMITVENIFETKTVTLHVQALKGEEVATDSIRVHFIDAIHEAMKSGDARLLPPNTADIESRIQQVIQMHEARDSEFLQAIYGDLPVVFSPGKHSRFFYNLDSQRVIPVVVGNDEGHLFVAAYDSGRYRAVALGDDMLDEMPGGEHAEFDEPLQQLVDWALESLKLSQGDGITVAMMLMSSGEMSNAKTWIKAQYPSAEVVFCGDPDKALTCIADAQLLVTGSDPDMPIDTVEQVLREATEQGTALLYLHNRGWNASELTNPVLAFFGLQTQSPGSPGNYFSNDAASWSSYQAMIQAAHATKRNLAAMVGHIQHETFAFDIINCAGGDEACVDQPAFKSTLLTPLDDMHETIAAFDQQGIAIFTEGDKHRLEKLFILLADRYRESIQFPMSRNITPTYDFVRSLVADYLVYNSRAINPAQSDLGDFSRTDFSTVNLQDKRVDLISREPFRAAGVYALPGQTVKVKRTDSSPIKAAIFINTVRTGTVDHMDNDGYVRPKFIQSRKMPIAAGETIEFTSPYGGPIQVDFDNKGTPMTFEFKQIGLHPFWREGDDDARFQTLLAQDAFDWVEIATEHFEVHSKADKILNTFDDIRWSTPTKLASYITKYHHNYHRVLAGVRGEAIDVVNEIHDFAASKGYEIPEFDRVQHMNADRASCGYGCSGNPYDAFWSFDVLGHGDLHEVGHNVESGRFKFNGNAGHTVTNFYSYYVKSRAFEEEDVAHSCQSLDFQKIHATIADSRKEADPFAYMQSKTENGWSYGATLIVQILMHAQNLGALDNGWHLIARLHLLENAFELADNSDEAWDEQKQSLGFGQFTREGVLALDNNDWLLIAASYSVGVDYRPFFDLVGQGYSSEASNQVAALSLTTQASGFYLPESDNAYCSGFSNQPLKTF